MKENFDVKTEKMESILGVFLNEEKGCSGVWGMMKVFGKDMKMLI